MSDAETPREEIAVGIAGCMLMAQAMDRQRQERQDLLNVLSQDAKLDPEKKWDLDLEKMVWFVVPSK